MKKTPEQIYAEWDAIDEIDRLYKKKLLPALLAKNEDEIDRVKGKMREQVKKLSEVEDDSIMV